MTCLQPFLADATPDANTTWLVLLTLASFGGNIATIIAVIIARGKQRREVSFSFEPASKEAFEKHLAANAQEHRDMFAKMGGMERGANSRLEGQLSELRQERKEDNNDLHEKINGVSIKVGGLEKSTELQNQTLAQMNSKLDRLAERRDHK